MNMELFEKAISRDEIHDFFMGNGSYFLRNRETHGHSFYMSVENVVIDYVKQGELSKIDRFIDNFKEFIDLLDDSSEKYTAILKNSYAICDVIAKVNEYSCDNDSVWNIGISIHNYFQGTKFRNDNLFDIYLERIESTGCVKISTAMKGDPIC